MIVGSKVVWTQLRYMRTLLAETLGPSLETDLKITRCAVDTTVTRS